MSDRSRPVTGRRSLRDEITALDVRLVEHDQRAHRGSSKALREYKRGAGIAVPRSRRARRWLAAVPEAREQRPALATRASSELLAFVLALDQEGGRACAEPDRLPARRRHRARGDGAGRAGARAAAARARDRRALPFGGAAIDELGDPLPAGDARRLPLRRRGAARRGRRAEVGRRRRAARSGAARAAQGARRLREPAPGSRAATSTW